MIGLRVTQAETCPLKLLARVGLMVRRVIAEQLEYPLQMPTPSIYKCPPGFPRNMKLLYVYPTLPKWWFHGVVSVKHAFNLEKSAKHLQE